MEIAQQESPQAKSTIKLVNTMYVPGNSGNSSEPHLHFHIQDTLGFVTATGIKCYFERIYVNSKIMNDHSPTKGEKIANIKH